MTANKSPISNFIFNSYSKYKNYDYKKSIALLINASNIENKPTKKPVMYIVAGPNGSGKSTLITNLVDLEIYNEKYVNASIYTTTVFNDIEDVELRDYKAMKYAVAEVERLISEKKSFVYETVLSHDSKLDLVKKAKAAGYSIVSIFCFTDNTDISINRVQKRVEQGGLDVSVDRIKSRYKNSLINAETLKSMSDEFYYFNNSKEIK